MMQQLVCQSITIEVGLFPKLLAIRNNVEDFDVEMYRNPVWRLDEFKEEKRMGMAKNMVVH